MPHAKIHLEIKGTVVLIDDDIDFVRLVIAVIRKFFVPGDLSVLVAYDGQSGVELIKRERPGMVLLDVDMPGMSGTTALSFIRSSHDPAVAGVHVIMLTARRDKDTVLKAVKTGANDYLSKPFKPEELVSRLKKFFSVRGPSDLRPRTARN